MKHAKKCSRPTTKRAKLAPSAGEPTAATEPVSDAEKAVLKLRGVPGKTNDRVVAEAALSSFVRNGQTALTFAKPLFGQLDFSETIAALTEEAATVGAGSMKAIEARLTAQAAALDSIFNELARRAALNLGEYLNAAESYMRLALKAQAQCRATLETLAEVKNPQPTSFVRQANVAIGGPQQVNNCRPPAESPAVSESPRAEDRTPESNKLLGVGNGTRLDQTPTETARATHSPMEALAILHRAPHAGRQGGDGKERPEARG